MKKIYMRGNAGEEGKNNCSNNNDKQYDDSFFGGVWTDEL